jgi:hypothetical protein
LRKSRTCRTNPDVCQVQHKILSSLSFPYGHWHKCIIHNSITKDLTSSVVLFVSPNASIIVKNLAEPLFGPGHTLQTHSYHNPPDPGPILKKNGAQVAGTLHLNSKNGPIIARGAKPKHSNHIAMPSHGMMVMKRMDKKLVS